MSWLGKFPYSTRKAAAAVLAVDGGNSKTDVALVGRDGAVLGAARGTGASHHRYGVQAAAAALDALVVAACRDAGLDPAGRPSKELARYPDDRPDRLHGSRGLGSAPTPLAEVGVWCLAGLDLPADDEVLAPAIAARGWAREQLLRNDVFAVLRSGSERSWGVGVVVGAGINCAGVAPDGTQLRFPALGPLSGDWGGGRDLGIAAVGAALRGQDGRGPRTALERLVPAHFGLPSPLAVVEAVHLRRIAEDRVLELAPLVFQAAEAGDAVAGRIVERQADEVVTMAGAAIRRLGLGASDVEVVLGGGVAAGRDPAFLERIAAGLARAAPRCRLLQATAPPVVGAALLGLDRLGAPPDAAGRLRGSLTYERLQPRQRTTASSR
jgi:N-acetylglucosamine kinase-like BadF-type ATPase